MSPCTFNGITAQGFRDGRPIIKFEDVQVGDTIEVVERIEVMYKYEREFNGLNRNGATRYFNDGSQHLRGSDIVLVDRPDPDKELVRALYDAKRRANGKTPTSGDVYEVMLKELRDLGYDIVKEK